MSGRGRVLLRAVRFLGCLLWMGLVPASAQGQEPWTGVTWAGAPTSGGLVLGKGTELDRAWLGVEEPQDGTISILSDMHRRAIRRRKLKAAGLFFGGVSTGLVALSMVEWNIPFRIVASGGVIAGVVMHAKVDSSARVVEIERLRSAAMVGNDEVVVEFLEESARKGRFRRRIVGGILTGATSAYYLLVASWSDTGVESTVSGALVMVSVGIMLSPSFEERALRDYEELIVEREARLEPGGQGY